jgi:hypothetical protein
MPKAPVGKGGDGAVAGVGSGAAAPAAPPAPAISTPVAEQIDGVNACLTALHARDAELPAVIKRANAVHDAEVDADDGHGAGAADADDGHGAGAADADDGHGAGAADVDDGHGAGAAAAEDGYGTGAADAGVWGQPYESQLNRARLIHGYMMDTYCVWLSAIGEGVYADAQWRATFDEFNTLMLQVWDEADPPTDGRRRAVVMSSAIKPPNGMEWCKTLFCNFASGHRDVDIDMLAYLKSARRD